MLPQDAHEHEYRRDENQCERHLRHGSGGKGFDVNVRAGASVVFFVPAGKCGEEEEGEEGEDEGDDAVGIVSSVGCYQEERKTHSK